MDYEFSLEPLFKDLVRRGLPIQYARRSVDELSDHHADLLAEHTKEGHSPESAETAARDRLGSRRKLARKIAGDFHRRSFAGRWPLFTFLLGPPVMLVLAWTATFIVATPIVFIFQQFNICNGGDDGVFDLGDRIFWHSFWFLLTVVVPGLLAVAYTKLARRSGMHVAWAAPALLSISLLAANPSFHVHEEIQRGELMLTMPVATVGATHKYAETVRVYAVHCIRSPQQIAQWLTPLGLGTAMLAWGSWQRRKMVRLDDSTTNGHSGSTPSIAA